MFIYKEVFFLIKKKKNYIIPRPLCWNKIFISYISLPWDFFSPSLCPEKVIKTLLLLSYLYIEQKIKRGIFLKSRGKRRYAIPSPSRPRLIGDILLYDISSQKLKFRIRSQKEQLKVNIISCFIISYIIVEDGIWCKEMILEGK